ncbi:MAG: tetratricopeptide repeat protein [Proteobacteria bacterium]|nr:tetratricopeptide repeat protein [Pseudomonadota bacterium]
MKIRNVISNLVVMILLFMSGISQAASGEDIPIVVSIMLNKAQILASRGKVEEAIKTLTDFQDKGKEMDSTAAEKQGYSHCNIDYAIGNYYLMLSQPEAAAMHYQSAVQKKNDFSEAWLNLAKCRYDLDRMKPAGDAFLKGYETGSPGSAKSLYFSAVCYAGAEDYAASYAVFHRLLETHPQDIELEWKGSFVQVLLALSKSMEALPHIEELAEKTDGEKQKKWREMLLYQYMALNMETKALNYAKWLTCVDTLEPKWWKTLAHLHLQKDTYEKALTALMAYGFLTPLSPEEISLVGDICLALEIPDQAIKYYDIQSREAVDPKTVKKLVQAYMRLYDRETALVWVDKIENQEKQPDLLMLKGNLLFEMERFSEAAVVFQQLSKNNHDHHEKGKSFLMLGYAAWNDGNVDQAKRAFEQAIKFEKQRKEAEKALKQLKGKP